MGPGSKSEAVFSMTVSLAWRDCDPRPSHRPGYKQDGDDLETWRATCRQHESGQESRTQRLTQAFELRGMLGSSTRALNQAFGSGHPRTCAITASSTPFSPSVSLLLLARTPVILGGTWTRCGLA